MLILNACQKKGEKTDEEEKDSGVELASADLKKSEKKYGYNLNDFKIEYDTIKSGDSFDQIITKNGLSSDEVYKITNQVQDSFDLSKLVAGKPYVIIKSKNDSIDKATAFIYEKDKVNYTLIKLKDSISVEKRERPVTTKKRKIAGIINSSLSDAMDKSGAPPALISEIATLYQWKIDFFRIQKKDKFKVIYTEKYVDDTIYAGIDKIDAAEFTTQDEPNYAFRFGEDKESGYAKFYDEEAKSLQNFFLKAPVEYTRISSRYSPRRYHPVQKRWKEHLGTDYAAPSGTPIQSTANGTIVESSYNRFNGHYVKVKHNGKYTTQYLHMSKRNAQVGQRVKQGDVIGYVGQTGLATGPHVCYRFWVNGVQKDPYQQRMPSSDPLNDSLKEKYFAKIDPLKKELDEIEIKDPEEDTQYANMLTH